MHAVFAFVLLILFASGGFAQSLVVTTYAGALVPGPGTAAVAYGIGGPNSLIPDGTGGFYVSTSKHRIYRVTSDGEVHWIAGSSDGSSGYSGDNAPAIGAKLNAPKGLALDSLGNLYVADSENHRIRKVSAEGVISTVAGNGIPGYGGDGGSALAAQLRSPLSIALDTAGNLYIADGGNRRVRRVTPDGVITSVAGNGTFGTGGDGGAATAAQFNTLSDVAADAAGNLYIADAYRVRKVTPDGAIRTVAGTVTSSSTNTGDGGAATSATLRESLRVALDSTGNLYISDRNSARIRKVTADGIINTIAGNGTAGYSGDGAMAINAQVYFPEGIAVDGAGNLYIADGFSFRVRKVTSAGVIATVAGNGNVRFAGDGSAAGTAQMNFPEGIAADALGNVYVSDTGNDRIRKIDVHGVINTVAGSTSSSRGDGGPATNARLVTPAGVAVDAAGNLYIADRGDHRIRKVTAGGAISTIVGTGSAGSDGDGGSATAARLSSPNDVALDSAGNLYIADTGNHRIRKVNPDGVITTLGEIGYPGSVAVDAGGNLYIAEYLRNMILKMTPEGAVSTVAGAGGAGSSGDGGPATAARLNAPRGVDVDSAGNLYIADWGNHRVRKVANDGVITTVAGLGTPGFSGDGGPAAAAQLNHPVSLAVDALNNLYIADRDNHRVRKVERVAPSNSTAFRIPDLGGLSVRTTGDAGSLVVGYGRIQPDSTSTTPAGVAIFGLRQGNVLVTEAGVPASPAISSGRICVEVNERVNTGLAIANPNNQAADISFYFTDQNGNNLGNETATIPANGQIAAFLNQSPFNGGSSVTGTFTFNSSVPIFAVALRGLTNERGEFLITTLPVADLSAVPTSTPAAFPHFADGGGWTTQFVLVNPTDSALTGTVLFRDQSGQNLIIGVNGQSNSIFPYSVPPRTSVKLLTAGTSASALVGSVRIVSDPGTITPSGVAIFSFRNGGITVTEAGVPATPAGNAFRLYSEVSGDPGAIGSLQTGVAVMNNSTAVTSITLELNKLDGTSTGLRGNLSVPANGQAALFLNQVQGLANLPTPFQGVLRVSSSTSISVIGLRGRYNERGDLLVTTTPSVNEAASPSRSALFFPHFADSGGYTTQFVLFSGSAGQSSSGVLQLFSQSGQNMSLGLR
ncbi:MAG TPA: NHL repeat-containing protein [Terriglobia bacterium]|nr:NHL repeat-containing protein [Terriglobia bacterium]